MEPTTTDRAIPISGCTDVNSSRPVGNLPKVRHYGLPDVARKNYEILSAAIPEICSMPNADAALSVAARTAAAEGFADWCLVDLVKENGEPPGCLRRVEVAGGYARPDRHELQEALACHIPDPAAPKGAPKVLRTSQPEFIREVTQAHLCAIARNRRHLDVLKRLDPGSYICVPLRAGRTLIGAMTFIRGRTALRYSTEDVSLANTIASLCGLVAALQRSEPPSTNGTARTRVPHGVRNGHTSPLTARHREILLMVRDGLSNAQIASALHIGQGTVKNHLKETFRRLGVDRRMEAVRAAERLGELPSP